MFTDRFIKLPIKVYDAKERDLTGKVSDYEDSWMKVNPFEISQYKPTSDGETLTDDCTYVSLKNGDGFYVYLTISEFEQILNNFDRQD